MNKVEIVLANTGERMMIEPGTQVAKLAEEYEKNKTLADGKAPWPILGALVNNKVEPLQYRIYNPRPSSCWTSQAAKASACTGTR